jgi:putative polymerase
LTSIHIGSREPTSKTGVDSQSFRWIALGVILSAVSFNALLCFINTNIYNIDIKAVIISEIIIILGTVLASYKSLNYSFILLISGAVLYNLMLALFRYNISPEAGIDVKIIRDFLIPIAFFMLGVRTKNLKTADSIVSAVTIFVFIFAIFEYFFLELYLRIFNVVQYYIARGTLELSDWALQVSKGLMISGIRPVDQGRGLLAFLGNHRVSSVFLEPSSLGNFGNIVVLWAIVRSRMEHRFYLWLTLAGISLIVLSDTRFDAGFLILGVILTYIPLRFSTPLVLVMPLFALLGMGFLVATVDNLTDPPFMGGTGIIDRLLYSGRVLAMFDVYNWLGIKVSRLQTFDAGYGYMISNAGIVGLTIFWLTFMSLKGSNRHFYVFRNVSAAYFATLFCISESQLSIKTAALLWFLMAALSVARNQKSLVSGDRPRSHIPHGGVFPIIAKSRTALIVAAPGDYGSTVHARLKS